MLPTAEIIAQSVRENPDVGIVATRTDDGSLRILVWNYHDVAAGFEEATAVKLQLNGLNTHYDVRAATLTRVDEHHANAFTIWRALGEPQSPTPAEIAALHAAAKLEPSSLPVAAEDAGSVRFDFHLLRHSVGLVSVPQRSPDRP